MSDVTRRDAMKLTAGMAIGVGALGTGTALGQDGSSKLNAKPVADSQLEVALKNPQMFMFTEQVVFETPVTGRNTFSVLFTSALDAHGKNKPAEIRRGSMGIFRADANRDAHTKKGGLYWKCGAKEGRIQFKHPGALVMAVREMDGTVRCYAMQIDLRC